MCILSVVTNSFFPSLTESTIFYNPAHLQLPSSKEELIAIVTAAGAQGRNVRVVGSGHSFSEVARSDDILVSMKNFKVWAHLQEASIGLQDAECGL